MIKTNFVSSVNCKTLQMITKESYVITSELFKIGLFLYWFQIILAGLN